MTQCRIIVVSWALILRARLLQWFVRRKRELGRTHQERRGGQTCGNNEWGRRHQERYFIYCRYVHIDKTHFSPSVTAIVAFMFAVGKGRLANCYVHPTDGNRGPVIIGYGVVYNEGVVTKWSWMDRHRYIKVLRKPRSLDATLYPLKMKTEHHHIHIAILLNYCKLFVKRGMHGVEGFVF